MPRLLTPGRLNPAVVPTDPVEVDWGHPLAQGLLFLVVPGARSGLRNLCGSGNNLSAPLGGSYIGAAPEGAALYSPSTNTAAYYGPVNATLQIQSGTVIWRAFHLPSGSINTYSNYFAVRYNSSGASPYNCYGLADSGDSFHPAFWYNAAGNSFSHAFGTSVTNGQQKRLAASFTASGAYRLYFNGAADGSGTMSAGAIAYDPTSPISLNGDPNNTSFPIVARASLAAIYGRVLTPGEVMWQDAEPFVMLRPVMRRTYSLPSAGGTYSGSLSETAATSESYTGAMTVAATLGETAATSDARTGLMVVASSLGETAATSESLTGLMVVAGSLTETTATSDAWVGGLGVYASSLSESVATNDTMAGLLVVAGSLTDSVATSDTWTRAPGLAASLAESIATLDAYTRTARMAATLAETMAATGAPFVPQRRYTDFFFGQP